MKWRSKATGSVFVVHDVWQSAQYGYRVGLIMDNEKRTPGPFLTYPELTEAFEKIEEVKEGMHDGWDTE